MGDSIRNPFLGGAPDSSMNTLMIFYASPEQLKTHPKNMRRWYPRAQVAEMADSIRARGGVIQALQVVANEHSGMYYVVDGNLRLHAARALGAECPPLKCELVDADGAEQLLTMSAANTVRYEPDPISEALHYRRLQQEENLTVRDISKATGVYEHRIYHRLKLLDLDEPVQKLMAEGKLPHDARVAEALLAIPDKRARVKLAERLAGEGAGIKAIAGAAWHLKHALEADARAKDQAPMVNHATKARGRALPEGKGRAKWAELREAGAAMCAACSLKEQALPEVAEPAWELIAHAAGETCDRCNLKDVANVCGACPGVELLKRLAERQPS